jgi:hypothetical protein
VRPKGLKKWGLDILEWSCKCSFSSFFPSSFFPPFLSFPKERLQNLSHDRLRHQRIRGAKGAGTPAATALATLSETTPDTLNRDTVDADAASGISTGIAYDHEHTSFFFTPLVPTSVTFFSDKRTLTTEWRCRGRVRVAKHRHHIGQSLTKDFGQASRKMSTGLPPR